MLIRPATEADRPLIHEVRKSAWKKAYAGLLPDVVIQEATSIQPQGKRGGLLIPEQILHSRITFVATKKDRVLGFVAGGLPREANPPADCELWAIYVSPEEQGSGIGRALIQAFRSAMRERKHRKMILWALKANAPSRLFYERMGGILEPTEKPFQWHGKEVAQEVAYSWILSD